MKTKKLWALIMALAMALSLAVPAFATNTATEATQNVNVTASNNVGAINITVAGTGAIVLNPYQMKATSGDDASYHQIFSVPVSCENKSTFGLKVNAVITGSLGDSANGAMAFVTSAPKDTDTGNNVFLYAEFGVSDSATTEPTWETAFNAKTPSQVLIGTTASTSKTVATLGAASNTKPNYLWYKFDGAITKSPTTAWTSNDTVTAAVALTLVPTVDTVYPITLTNTTSKTAAGTAKLNFDLAPAGETISVTCTADETLGGTPTVTATQGTTKLTVEGEGQGPFTFVMPAGDVAVTVKWAA